MDKIITCIDWKPTLETLSFIKTLIDGQDVGCIIIDNGDNTQSVINIHPVKKMDMEFAPEIDDGEVQELIEDQKRIDKIVPDWDGVETPKLTIVKNHKLQLEK